MLYPLKQQVPQAHRVLVVEDNASVARMLRVSLRASGFKVAIVGTGADALAELRKNPPDAVILDLGLPDGQGGAVVRELHRLQDLGDGPAWVVASAMNYDEEARTMGPLGAHFITKPYDPWALVRLLEGLLGDPQRS